MCHLIRSDGSTVVGTQVLTACGPRQARLGAPVARDLQRRRPRTNLASNFTSRHAQSSTYATTGFMGDAAHRITPCQDGIAIEESSTLYTLLGRASSRAEAVVALELCDPLRRPHTQRLLKSSREIGSIMAGRQGPQRQV